MGNKTEGWKRSEVETQYTVAPDPAGAGLAQECGEDDPPQKGGGERQEREHLR